MSNTATTVVTVTRVAQEDSPITSPPVSPDVFPQTNDPLSMIVWALIGIGIVGLIIAFLAGFMLTRRNNASQRNLCTRHPERVRPYTILTYDAPASINHTYNTHALRIAITVGAVVAASTMVLVLII